MMVLLRLLRPEDTFGWWFGWIYFNVLKSWMKNTNKENTMEEQLKPGVSHEPMDICGPLNSLIWPPFI